MSRDPSGPDEGGVVEPPDPPRPPGGSATELRNALCRAGRKLHEAKLIAGRAGNLSVRLDRERILITPSGAHKGRLEPSEIVTVPLEGDDPEAVSAASSELPLHLHVHREGADAGVRAVVHSHAPALTAIGLRGIDVGSRLPEIEKAVGKIAEVEFAPSGSEELGRAAGRAVRDGAGVLLLRRHGAAAAGRDLEGAIARTELAELAAYAVLLADGAGLELDLRRLTELHERAGRQLFDAAESGTPSPGSEN